MIIPGPEDLVDAYNESDDTEKTPKADKKNLAGLRPYPDTMQHIVCERLGDGAPQTSCDIER